MFGKQKQHPEERMLDKQLDHSKEQSNFQAALMDDAGYYERAEQRDDLTRWQQDLKDELDVLRHDLKHEIKDNRDRWIRELVMNEDGKEIPMPPMANELGVYRIIALTKRYLNRNVMMSNLNEEIIFRMMRDLVETLVIHLGSKYEQYEIDPNDLSLIIKMIKDSVETTLYRSLNNGERNYLNTINRRIETFADRQEPKRKGLFGMFGG